jgi:Uma2 family endonuclease
MPAAATASYVLLPNLLPEEVIGNMGVLRIPRDVHTLAGYRRWVHSKDFPEKLRSHYIQGDVYLDMTQESIQTHVLVKGAIFRTLPNLMIELDLGEFYPDGVLLTNKRAKISNNPDGLAVLWESFAAGRVRFIRRGKKEIEIQGSPDWIMEIVSDSSVKKDTKRLRQSYHRARISEYWLIDARGDQISFQILHWKKLGYSAAPVSRDGWQLSKVFGREFRLDRELNRRGAWTYTLLVRG